MELRLIYGSPSPSELSKQDAAKIPWATTVQNRTLHVGSRELLWQPVLRSLSGMQLVIVEDAAKLLVNYLLLLRQSWGGPQIALWGHGKTLSEHGASRVGEFLKRRMLRRAHWYFAYTEGTARILEAHSFLREQVTVVNNTLDVEAIEAHRASISPIELRAARAKLGLSGLGLAVYCGALYEEKRIPFLIEAADEVRSQLPDFELVMMGAGPQEKLVNAAGKDRKWLHVLGPVFGREKHKILMLADLMVMPGVVGLAAVDALALDLPLITIETPGHGPEIEYIEHGFNGLILPRTTSPSDFANKVCELLRDRPQLDRLREGCRATAPHLSMTEMVNRFAAGIVQAAE